MSEEQDHQSPILNHVEEKARLECEKLQAEIKAIGKPLFKTPGFYSAFAPVALAVLGLIFTWATGWFDVQRTRISNEKILVEAQTERLKVERTSLEAQTREQQARFTQAEDEIEKLRQRESYLTNQVAKLNREREELRIAKEGLENETKRLAGSDVKASQFLEQLKSLQLAREQLSSDLHVILTSNALLRVTAARQTALISWANKVLDEGWSIALKDKGTWAKFVDFGQHAQEVQLASMRYLPEWQVDPDPILPPKETMAAYDEDAYREAVRLLHQAARKTYADYVREAKERFDFLENHPSSQTGTNMPGETQLQR